MDFAGVNIPEPVRIEIAPVNRRPRAFTIGLLRQDTCRVVQGLFEHVGKELLDLETAKATNYRLVEQHRGMLSMIIAIAMRNYKAEYSRKVKLLVENNTNGHELLALVYVVQRQTALFTVSHYLHELEMQKINAQFHLAEEERLLRIRDQLGALNKQEEALIEELQHISESENAKSRLTIRETTAQSKILTTYGA